MARPKKYATPADRQAAYRNRWAVIEARIERETAETLDDIAAQLDVSRNEVIASMLKFALLNRNWKQVGLFGKRLPTAISSGAQKGSVDAAD